MKANFKTIKVMTAYLAIAALLGCSKKDTAPSPQNCSENSQKVIDAGMAYGTNPTKANCETYKRTVQDFYKSCATFYNSADKKDLDEFLAEPCPN